MADDFPAQFAPQQFKLYFWGSNLLKSSLQFSHSKYWLLLQYLSFFDFVPPFFSNGRLRPDSVCIPTRSHTLQRIIFNSLIVNDLDLFFLEQTLLSEYYEQYPYSID